MQPLRQLLFGVSGMVKDPDALMNVVFADIAGELQEDHACRVEPNPFPTYPDWHLKVEGYQGSFFVCGAIYWVNPGRWGIGLEQPFGQILNDENVWTWMMPIIERAVQRHTDDFFWTTDWNVFHAFARPR